MEALGKVCVIVDGLSTGKYYAEMLKPKGYTCLHIQSRPDIHKDLMGCFCTSIYSDAIIFESKEKTIAWIKEKGCPEFIIPGCELGVGLADELSNIFNTDSQNEITKSKARRDKYLMSQELQKNGLRIIKQMLCKSYKEAITGIKKLNLKLPVVIKPTESTSGDGFRLCHSFEEIQSAFDDNLHKKNLLSVYNKALLLQEYIQGVEYVVDTVSCKGVPVVTDIMKYSKRISKKGYSVYESCDFLSLSYSEEVEKLKNYAIKILDILGLKYGPAHIEIMVDKEGPVLIELGARLAGCMLDPQFISNTYGHNQVEFSILSYTSYREFLDKKGKMSDTIQKHSSLVFLIPKNEGYLTQAYINKIQELDAFEDIDSHITLGQYVSEPQNLSKSLAIIYLQHEDSSKVNEAKKEIIDNPDKFISVSQKVENNSSDKCGVDVNYLNYTATLCGEVKKTSYELAEINKHENLIFNVLDVGCGIGTDTINISKIVSEKSRIVGIDSDPIMIEEAKLETQKNGKKTIEYYCEDATEFSFNNEFDLVRAERLFQHLKSPDIVFKNMISAVKPNGRIIIIDTDWNTLRCTLLDEKENLQIAEAMSTQLTYKVDMNILKTMFQKYQLTNIKSETIGVKLTYEDYLKATKIKENMNKLFDEATCRKLNECIIPGINQNLFAVIDIVLMTGCVQK
jgi:ubiquinone/menaquinone biosynthesis C-methylase UbiE